MELTRLFLDPDFFDGVAAQMSESGSYQGEVVATAKSRRLYHLEVRAARFRYRKKDSLLLVVHDITERKHAQLALRRANDMLEQRVSERTQQIEAVNAELQELNERLRSARDHAVDANRAKSAFLANMSHELRTPLNAIIGYAELIEEEFEGAQDATHLKDLRRIGTSAFHLLALINDVLDVSKIEAGKMDVFIETFDANALIEDVAETVETLAARNQNQLVFEFLGEHRTVAADRTKVRQILYNLLSNACKFTDRGTITLRAEIVADGEGVEWLEIEVVDSGIGIPADRLEELFLPFRQADESTTRKYGGTGLGLAITRSFCEPMGGTVLASSVVGQGSTFAVRIPRRVGSARLDPEPPAAGDASA